MHWTIVRALKAWMLYAVVFYVALLSEPCVCSCAGTGMRWQQLHGGGL